MKIAGKNVSDIGVSSTSAMHALLTNPNNKRVIEFINQLFTEKNPIKIAIIKNLIIAFIKEQKVNVLSLQLGQKSAIKALFEYYQTIDPAQDELFDLIHKLEFEDSITELLEQRFGQDEINFALRVFGNDIQPEHNKFSNTVGVSFECFDLAEAALIAYTLEEILHDTYGIPVRSGTKEFAVNFKVLDDHRVIFFMRYRPEDYYKINPFLPVKINDACLWQTYTDIEGDFYDYCAKKHNIINTRDLSSTTSPPEPDEGLALIAQQAIESDTSSIPVDYDGELLLFTRTVLGAGNYMNARVTLEGICARWPRAKISWVVINDGDILPQTTNLPPQVTRYEADADWKLYPVIQAKSLSANVIIGLPNMFITHIGTQLPDTPVFLRNDGLFIIVHEYNQPMKPEHAPRYLNLYSGINAGVRSLGILKPRPLEIPETLDTQLANLMESSPIASLFKNNPDAPLYFAYLYQGKKQVNYVNIQGLKIDEILATFIQHAKLANHEHIKIVIPITPDAVQLAMTRYPTVFKDCSIRYEKDQDSISLCHESGLTVEIFNPFPLANSTFRALMNYSASQHNPVVTTGDQSLIEMFFTLETGFLFLYQVMGHKQALYDTLKEISVKLHLPRLHELLIMTELGMGGDEEKVTRVATFLIQNQDSLREESMSLKTEIQSQPDLCATLTGVIEACLNYKNQLTINPVQANSAMRVLM